MAIIQTVSECDFRDAFRAFNRTENFGHEALGLLFEYIDNLSDELGEPIELDVIGLCCEWSEYATAVEAAKEYGWSRGDIDTDDPDVDHEEAALSWLRDRTQVIEGDSCVVIQQF